MLKCVRTQVLSIFILFLPCMPVDKLNDAIASGDVAHHDEDENYDINDDDDDDDVSDAHALPEEEIIMMLKLRKQQLKYERMFGQANDVSSLFYRF